MKIRLTAAMLCITTGFALAGCAPAAGPAGTPTSIDTSRISPTGMPTPPQVKDAKGDIKDLTVGQCATGAGQQTVTGELKSTLSAAADFLVTISWTNATGDVMGRGFQVVKALEPGKSEKIEITAKVGAGATQCVTGVEYGTIAK